MKKVLIALTLFYSYATVNAAEIISLNTMYKNYHGSLRHDISKAKLLQNKYRLQQAHANDDWEIFGSIGASRNSEVLTSSSDRKYNATGGTIGLRYPLFGTMEAKENNVYLAEGTYAIEKQNSLEIIDEDLYQITSSYINYWIALHKKYATKNFLASEYEIKTQLLQRKSKGLLYESDYLELLSAFSLARRNMIKSQQNIELALRNFSIFMNGKVTPFVPTPAYFDNAPITAKEKDHIVMQDKTLKILDIEKNTLNKIIKNSDWSGIESDFSIAQSIGYETNPDGDTNSLSAAINLRMPFGIASHKHSQKKILKYQLQEKEAEYSLRKSEIIRQINNQELDCETKLNTVDLQKIRLEGTSSTKYRQQLRVKMVDGDVIEQSVQADIRHYVQYLDYLDALNNYLQAKATYNKLISKPYIGKNISTTMSKYYNLLPSSNELQAVIF